MRNRNRKQLISIILILTIMLNAVPVYVSASQENILMESTDTAVLQDEMPQTDDPESVEEASRIVEDINLTTEDDILSNGEDSIDLSDSVRTDDEGTNASYKPVIDEVKDNDVQKTEGSEPDENEVLLSGENTIKEYSTEENNAEVNKAEENPAETSSEEYSMGEQPIEMQIEAENPSYNRRKLFSKYSAEGVSSLPASFIPSDLPALRNQNPYSTCWAFSSIALAEMSLIRQGKISVEDVNKIDLSELHLAFFTYNTVTDPLGGTKGDKNELTKSSFLYSGGNREFAKNILAEWSGAVDEEVVPYGSASEVAHDGLDSALAFLSSAQLRNYYDISLFTTDDDGKHTGLNEDGMRAAKELIKSNGAVGLSFKAVSSSSAATSKSYYNEDNNCYYDPNGGSTNHAVTVVGWDDNFDRNRFTTVPEGDGAWLVRNSWKSGGSYEDSQCYAGYFWLSYYNMNTGKAAHAFVFDLEDDHYNNYQYDGGMYTWCIEASKAANIFRAHAARKYWEYEKVKAASFYTKSANVDYTIDVYTKIKDPDDPESGTLRSTTTGTTTYAGYYTIPLSKEVDIYEGESFSVVVTLSKTGGTPYIGAEYSEKEASWYKIETSAEAGQSFVFDEDLEEWSDYGADKKANIKIKAFTKLADKEGKFDISFADGVQGEKFREYDYTGTAIKPEINVLCDDIVLREGEDYTVSYKNNVNSFEPSSPEVIKSKDPQVTVNLKGDYSGKYSMNFKINSVDLSDYHKDGIITAAPVTALVKKSSKGEVSIQKLVPDVYYGNRKLTKGTDYILVYEDNREGAYKEACPASNPWKITVRAKGNNFKGSFETDEILKDNSVSPCVALNNKNVKAVLSASAVGYGEELPSYTLTYKDPADKTGQPYVLVENVDYVVETYNTDTVGNATYIFTAHPASERFTGSISKKFRIKRTDISKAKIEVNLIPEDLEDAYSEKGPENNRIYTYVKGGVKPSVKVEFTDHSGEKRILRNGTDYKLTYGNYNVIRKHDAKNPPYVKITGLGCFSGSIKETFSIIQSSIEKLPEPIVGNVIFSKTKNAFKKTSVVFLDSNGKELVKDKDYTLTDFRTEGGTLTPGEGTMVSAVITGKGMYAGSRDISYLICSKDISKTSITFYKDIYMDEEIKDYTYTGHEIRPAYIDLRTNGKNSVILEEDDDYIIAGYYDNINCGNGYIIIKGIGDYGGIKKFKFRIISRKYSY